MHMKITRLTCELVQKYKVIMSSETSLRLSVVQLYHTYVCSNNTTMGYCVCLFHI